MDYFLTDEQKEIQRLAREIAEKEIRPVAAKYDRNSEFAWPVVKTMAETDLFRVFVDDAYDGMGGDSPIFNLVLVTEELSKACGGIALAFLTDPRTRRTRTTEHGRTATRGGRHGTRLHDPRRLGRRDGRASARLARAVDRDVAQPAARHRSRDAHRRRLRADRVRDRLR